MAKAKIFKIQGGRKTYFIPANGVKTVDEAAMSVGLSAGGYVGLTVYSKEGETAEEFVTRKGGTITEVTMDIDYSRASIAEELPPATGEERFGATETPPTSAGTTTPTAGQLADYQNYLALLDTALGNFLPHPKDINDFLPHADEWFAQFNELKRGYQTYLTYYSGYGTSDDWKPLDIYDYYSNYDKAQPYLTEWQKLAIEKEAEYTDDQLRDYYNFKNYASAHAELGEGLPVDIADYFAGYDQYQGMLTTFQQRELRQKQNEQKPKPTHKSKENISNTKGRKHLVKHPCMGKPLLAG